MKKINAHILIPHIEACRALEQVADKVWGTPWAVLGKESFFGSSGARSNRRHRFLVAVCNDPSCPGKIAVDEDAIFANILPLSARAADEK